MNRRGLFGINILLIVVFFVIGVILGGYVVLKTQGFLKDVTSFVIEEPENSDNTNNASLDDSADDEIILEDYNDSDDLGNFSFDELNGSNNLTFNSS